LVACMRKLLLIAHHLYVTKSTYRPLEHDANPCLPSSRIVVSYVS
jgi:hypothetical protein